MIKNTTRGPQAPAQAVSVLEHVPTDVSATHRLRAIAKDLMGPFNLDCGNAATDARIGQSSGVFRSTSDDSPF
jgi:hypothetical protein